MNKNPQFQESHRKEDTRLLLAHRGGLWSYFICIFMGRVIRSQMDLETAINDHLLLTSRTAVYSLPKGLGGFLFQILLIKDEMGFNTLTQVNTAMSGGLNPAGKQPDTLFTEHLFSVQNCAEHTCGPRMYWYRVEVERHFC